VFSLEDEENAIANRERMFRLEWRPKKNAHDKQAEGAPPEQVGM